MARRSDYSGGELIRLTGFRLSILLRETMRKAEEYIRHAEVPAVGLGAASSDAAETTVFLVTFEFQYVVL